MDKPGNDAPAGWYEVPGERNSERYWDGTNWTAQTRKAENPQISEDSNDSKIEVTLGKFLFRNPITSDWAFITYLVILGFTMFSSIKQDYGNGSSLPYILVIPEIAVTGIWIYILFLVVLIPRRMKDKRRGMLAPIPSEKSDSLLESKVKSKKAVVIAVSVFALIGASLVIGKSSNSNAGDEYFEVEQRISSVVKEWNVAATPISQAVMAISQGTMGAAEAIRISGEASTQFALISNKLTDACQTIPEYEIDAPGIEGAMAKAYEALQVTCDLLPQESTEILLLVREQISPAGSQAKIDYHSNQISQIISKRKTAVLESLDAMYPYLTDAQKQNADRLRTGISN